MSMTTPEICDQFFAPRTPSDSPVTLDRIRVNRVQLTECSQLSPAMIQIWRDLQANNPSLASPYFSFEFFQSASYSRVDAEVAILYADNKVIGFFPFHRLSQHHGIPIGGAINDYQGIIGQVNLDVDPSWLIHQCKLTRWDFHSLWWPRLPFLPHCFQVNIPASSAWLGHNIGGYLDVVRQGSTTIARQPQKSRKMVRELGPLKFEVDDRNPGSLNWVISQKRNKYQRTGCTDFFEPRWTKQLLNQINQTQQAHFRGLCSVLKAGDTIVAAHFGMLANGRLHYWYPVFDRQYHQYSPGTELYLQIVQAAARFGIRQIDMGYGIESFKTKIVNQWGLLANGSVDLNRSRYWWNRLASQTADRIKNSPWRNTVKTFGRAIIPNLGKPKVK